MIGARFYVDWMDECIPESDELKKLHHQQSAALRLFSENQSPEAFPKPEDFGFSTKIFPAEHLSDPWYVANQLKEAVSRSANRIDRHVFGQVEEKDPYRGHPFDSMYRKASVRLRSDSDLSPLVEDSGGDTFFAAHPIFRKNPRLTEILPPGQDVVYSPGVVAVSRSNPRAIKPLLVVGRKSDIFFTAHSELKFRYQENLDRANGDVLFRRTMFPISFRVSNLAKIGVAVVEDPE